MSSRHANAAETDASIKLDSAPMIFHGLWCRDSTLRRHHPIGLRAVDCGRRGDGAMEFLGRLRERLSRSARVAAKNKTWANIPVRSNRKDTFAFSAWVYRQRNLVERFFNRIKQFRGIATRYDKDPRNFLAAVKLIALRIWCAA
jgi:transposase